ncbi:reverse transcriptase domain-containing protein [Tanacetum coccineum]
MVDQRTMAERLRAPTEGYAEAIVVPPILAEYFKLKHILINLITSTLKYKDVPETSIKLMLFPFSIDGLARIWLDEEPPCFILTWDNLVSKFINHFFPPSKTTNLRNEISNFQQRFDETFYEAWDRFKDFLRACLHHGFTELHQLDTFYNGLNPSNQDSLNSAAGGNLLERVLEMSTPPPASVKAVEEICVTCGGAHPYYQCLAADGNTFLEYRDNIQGYVAAAAGNYNQGNSGYRPPGNEMQNSIQTSMSNQTNELKNMMASFFQMNTASTSGTGSLPSNTVANPKGELKAITTRSGLVLDGPSVPMPPPFINPEEDERVEGRLLYDPEL